MPLVVVEFQAFPAVLGGGVVPQVNCVLLRARKAVCTLGTEKLCRLRTLLAQLNHVPYTSWGARYVKSSM